MIGALALGIAAGALLCLALFLKLSSSRKRRPVVDLAGDRGIDWYWQPKTPLIKDAD